MAKVKLFKPALLFTSITDVLEQTNLLGNKKPGENSYYRLNK